MFKIEGLDKLQNRLNDLADKAQALDGHRKVPLAELLSASFLSRHTKFLSLHDLLAASGFKVESTEDFSAIPDDDWDKFIRSISNFQSWEAMLGAAGEDWLVKQLGL